MEKVEKKNTISHYRRICHDNYLKSLMIMKSLDRSKDCSGLMTPSCLFLVQIETVIFLLAHPYPSIHHYHSLFHNGDNAGGEAEELNLNRSLRAF